MILLKNTLNKVKDGLLSTKTLSQMQNNFVFHLVFLSAVFFHFSIDQGLPRHHCSSREELYHPPQAQLNS